MLRVAFGLLPFVLMTGCVSPGGTSTPDRLGDLVVSSLKENDFEMFLEGAITPKLMRALMADARIQSERRKERAKEFAAQFADARAVRRRMRDSFDDVREQGLDRGVKWEAADFVKAAYETHTRDDVEFCNDIQVDFRVGVWPNERRFRLFVTDCVNTDAGWRTLMGVRWGGELVPRPREGAPVEKTPRISPFLLD